MHKIWKWFKNDFRNVSEAMYYMTNGKAPKWVIAFWYVMMFPIGLFLYPIAIVYGWYLQYKLAKMIREAEED